MVYHLKNDSAFFVGHVIQCIKRTVQREIWDAVSYIIGDEKGKLDSLQQYWW
jgi:hypothetical protein